MQQAMNERVNGCGGMCVGRSISDQLCTMELLYRQERCRWTGYMYQDVGLSEVEARKKEMIVSLCVKNQR